MSFYRIKFLKQNASISATITNAWHFYAQANSLQCRYYHHHRLQRIDPFISSVHYNNQRCTYASKSIKIAEKRTGTQHWREAMNEAQKIVTYLPQFQSVGWLIDNEVGNIKRHFDDLTKSNDPLLKTAKHAALQMFVLHRKTDGNPLYHGRNNMQAWDMIVLLMSKVADQTQCIQEMGQDKRLEVQRSQQTLAEICELIRISHLVHQGVINMQPLIQTGQDLSLYSDMTFGNKVALLGGDHLLGRAYVQLASLRNQELIEVISSAVRDLTEAEFIGDRDEQNNPLPSQPSKSPKRIACDLLKEYDLHLADDVLKPMEKERYMGIPETEWALRNILCAGSLLGKSCLGALKLAGLPESTQKLGFHFGKHLVLAWQACLDLEPFLQPKSSEDVTFSLVSAPVLFHLEYDPNAYELIKKGYVSVENVDYKTLHSEILKGPGVEKTQNLQRKHSMAAMKVLNEFPSSDARTALENIIHAMGNLRVE